MQNSPHHNWTTAFWVSCARATIRRVQIALRASLGSSLCHVLADMETNYLALLEVLQRTLDMPGLQDLKKVLPRELPISLSDPAAPEQRIGLYEHSIAPALRSFNRSLLDELVREVVLTGQGESRMWPSAPEVADFLGFDSQSVADLLTAQGGARLGQYVGGTWHVSPAELTMLLENWLRSTDAAPGSPLTSEQELLVRLKNLCENQARLLSGSSLSTDEWYPQTGSGPLADSIERKMLLKTSGSEYKAWFDQWWRQCPHRHTGPKVANETPSSLHDDIREEQDSVLVSAYLDMQGTRASLAETSIAVADRWTDLAEGQGWVEPFYVRAEEHRAYYRLVMPRVHWSVKRHGDGIILTVQSFTVSNYQLFRDLVDASIAAFQGEVLAFGSRSLKPSTQEASPGARASHTHSGGRPTESDDDWAFEKLKDGWPKHQVFNEWKQRPGVVSRDLADPYDSFKSAMRRRKGKKLKTHGD